MNGASESPDSPADTIPRMLISPRYDGPPILSLDGAADDQLVPVTRQRRRLEATLARLGDDEWAAPSRCAGWSVQDVVAHLVGTNAFWHASVVAGLAGTPSRVLAAFDPAATPPLMVDTMRSLTPPEVLARFVATNDAFLDSVASLDSDSWSTIGESPAGHVPIRLLAQHALWDAWIHERDIALPLGSNPAAEPDEVGSSLRYAAAISPALAIGMGHAASGRFAVEATEPAASFNLVLDDSVVLRDGPVDPAAPCLRGDAITLVEALSLRAPLPADAPAEWHDVLRGLAAAFDTEVVA